VFLTLLLVLGLSAAGLALLLTGAR
jgi:hypothetical protein